MGCRVFQRFYRLLSITSETASTVFGWAQQNGGWFDACVVSLRLLVCVPVGRFI